MAKEDERMSESTRERKYIISVDNNYKFYWDLWIIVLAIYNTLALPLLIAFAEAQKFYDEHIALDVLEISVDVFFFFDIIIMFNTAYIDVYAGETIRQPKLIAQNYLKKGFITDFLSTLPLILKPLVSGGWTTLVTSLRLMKLLRLRKISKMINNLNWSIAAKS